MCFLAAIVEVAKRKKSEPLGPLFWTALALAPLQIRMGLLLNGTLLEKPLLGTFAISGIFLMGPLVLNMARTMIDFTFGRFISLWPHFLPAILLLGFDIWYVMISHESRVAFINDGFYANEHNIISMGILAGLMHVGAYFITLTWLNIKVKTSYDLKYSRMVWVLLILPILGIVAWFFSIAFSIKILGFVGGIIFLIVCLSFFLFTARYPNFFNNLRIEIDNQRYKSTSLGDIDIPGICQELEHMMCAEKVYRDETLRLAYLADELGVSKHQLSRILNEQFKKNFNEYINSFRVAEAAKLLVQNPQKSILDIAFEVGFNSKTTFNQQFSRITGQTPKKVRQNKGNK